jgi:phospholipid/cholesterol/gamma-HCH transport system substrate-binding protein
METSARYAIVGFFTLASLLAGFLFVFWLHNSGGVGQQAMYWIRFDRPVLGVRPGVSVMFNGLRVGEVRQLRLVAGDPKEVMALVAIDPTTPVRQDTRVEIDSQGLMGSAVVSLVGGTPEAGAPQARDGEPPVLLAAPDAGKSLTGAAKQTLAKIDDLIGENSESIHSTIDNISTFAAALARNSDKVDAIVAGIEKMTGGGPAAKPQRSFDIPAPQVAPSAKTIRAQVAIPDPTGEILFDSQKMLVSPHPGQREPIDGGQWSDTLPKLIQQKMLQGMEAAGFSAVSKAMEGFEADDQLLLDIRAFELNLDPQTEARVEIGAKIMNKAGKLIAMRKFAATAPASGAGAPEAAAAMGQAFAKAAADLTIWVRDTI